MNKIFFAMLVLPASMIFAKNAAEQTKCTNAASQEYAATNSKLKAEFDAISQKVGHLRKTHQTAVSRLQEAKKKKADSKSNAHDKDIARFERLVHDTNDNLKKIEPEFAKANKKYREGTEAARKKMDAAKAACKKK